MPTHSFANRIAGFYAVAGAIWILAGSKLADTIFGADIAGYASFDIAKGLFFIGATTLALRWLLLHELERRNEVDDAKVKATERLILLLDQSVEALSHTLSQRDPYTAGHQERVAALSVAIARRMGLPENTVLAIRTGALLHDVGKIGIPAEILSKPGRLSADEFNLVKGHAQIGRAIVDKIDFDPAVHAIVGQHHERIDGTGYPNRLSGGDIRLEVRIVAVADVVEAMTSHRPYRPALGIAAAKEEIGILRGTKLDADVVDACLSIIDEGLDHVWPEFGALPKDVRPLSSVDATGSPAGNTAVNVHSH